MCNWWGDASGPEHGSNPSGTGDAVTDNITYEPWLVGPAPDGSCTGPDPCAALDKLIEDLEGMNLHKGTNNSLNAKLTAAKKSCGKGKFKTASNQMRAFINECEDQSGKKLTVEQADLLIEQAEGIMEGFNNVSPSIKTFGNDDSVTNIEEFTLIQNYPNPFNPTTSIKYRLPMNVHVSVQIYDILGQLVATLVNSEQSAGLHEVVWNGTNARGELVPSGTYISRVKTDNEVKTINMMYLK